MTSGHPNGSMASHPYYPPDLVLPGFMPNEIPVPILIASFAGASGLVVWITSVLARTIRPRIDKTDLLTAMWFMLCGCIHLFFEGWSNLLFFRSSSKTPTACRTPLPAPWLRLASNPIRA